MFQKIAEVFLFLMDPSFSPETITAFAGMFGSFGYLMLASAKVGLMILGASFFVAPIFLTIKLLSTKSRVPHHHTVNRWSHFRQNFRD